MCEKDTVEECLSWLEHHESLHSFGKPDRWLKPLDFKGESIDESTESRTIVNELSGEEYTEYFFPKEYTIGEPIDISSEVEAKEILNSRIKEYGTIGDQLDEIFHDIEAWKSRIQSIKDKYPK